MSRINKINDELLHAFVDDELDPQERQLVLDAMSSDLELTREVAELQRLKQMMQAARPDESALSKLHLPKRTCFCLLQPRMAVAASLLFVVFLVSGLWFMPMSSNDNRSTPINISDEMQTRVAQEEMRVVLHVNQSDPATAEQLFIQLNNMLANNHQPLRIEVVAVGPGLNLLRADKSNYAAQIQQIRAKFDNVVFIACQTTLQRMMMKLNKKIPMLPEAMLTASGPELIELRKSQGWKYMLVTS